MKNLSITLKKVILQGCSSTNRQFTSLFKFFECEAIKLPLPYDFNSYDSNAQCNYSMMISQVTSEITVLLNNSYFSTILII